MLGLRTRKLAYFHKGQNLECWQLTIMLDLVVSTTFVVDGQEVWAVRLPSIPDRRSPSARVAGSGPYYFSSACRTTSAGAESASAPTLRPSPMRMSSIA
jgi:hypothetical protein